MPKINAQNIDDFVNWKKQQQKLFNCHSFLEQCIGK